MTRLTVASLALVSAALLSACAGGPVRRVSPPAAAIQQLTVDAKGGWTVALRIENFSSVPMRFGATDLALSVDGVDAGRLRADAAVTIGPESADVATLALVPSPAARLRIADALATRRSVAYTFEGTLVAVPEDGGERSFPVERDSALAPVPGLPGVLR